MTMNDERVQEIQGRLDAATDGPWAAWTDQDGAAHMDGMLMVGNAEAVIPDGQMYVENVDVNPIAHVYTPEDREFVAHARQDVPDLLAEVEDLLMYKRWASTRIEECNDRLQEPLAVTDDMVERAAIQMCATGRNASIWATFSEVERDDFRKDAREALTAALGSGDGE